MDEAIRSGQRHVFRWMRLFFCARQLAVGWVTWSIRTTWRIATTTDDLVKAYSCEQQQQLPHREEKYAERWRAAVSTTATTVASNYDDDEDGDEDGRFRKRLDGLVLCLRLVRWPRDRRSFRRAVLRPAWRTREGGSDAMTRCCLSWRPRATRWVAFWWRLTDGARGGRHWESPCDRVTTGAASLCSLPLLTPDLWPANGNGEPWLTWHPPPPFSDNDGPFAKHEQWCPPLFATAGQRAAVPARFPDGEAIAMAGLFFSPRSVSVSPVVALDDSRTSGGSVEIAPRTSFARRFHSVDGIGSAVQSAASRHHEWRTAINLTDKEAIRLFW